MSQMMKAMKTGNVELIKRIYAACPIPKDREGNEITTWMIIAGGIGTKETIQTLYDLDPSTIDRGDKTSITPILSAVVKENLEALELIHRLRKCHIDTPTGPSARSPLWVAVREGCLKSIDKLIELGADIEQKSISDAEPLINVAIEGRHPASVRKLCQLKRGWIDARRKVDGPFHTAAIFDQGEAIKILYNAGYTKIDTPDELGRPPLRTAVTFGALNALAAFHALGSNVHFQKIGYLSAAVDCDEGISLRLVGRSTRAAQITRRLYYSRSLAEVLFFTQPKRATQRRQK